MGKNSATVTGLSVLGIKQMLVWLIFSSNPLSQKNSLTMVMTSASTTFQNIW